MDDFDKLKYEIKYFFIAIGEFLKFKFNIINTNQIKKYKKLFSFFNFLTGISSLRFSNLIINFIKKSSKIILITLEGILGKEYYLINSKKIFKFNSHRISIFCNFKNTNSLFLKLGKFEQILFLQK